jgi:hypothetical protein
MSEAVGSSLHHLSDDALIDEVKRLVEKERTAEAELIAHLAEVDARKLYLREACPSMFAYCTAVLHFSESAAYHRITAARAARRIPALLEKLQAGEIHLSGVGVLAPHLTPENHLELLARARYKSKREIEELVAELRPRPSAPSSVRRLPILAPRAPAAPPPPLPPQIPQQGARTELPSSPRGELAFPTSKAPAAPRPEPLGRERFRVQFTVSRETREKLAELQALLRHEIPDGDIGRIVDRALGLLLEEVKRRKFAATSRPRTRNGFGDGFPSRHVPAEIRRTVVAREGGRCRFVSPSGRRCESRELIEFHHRIPWGHLRAHSADGIELRCRAHNQYEAELVFGAAHMERCRRESHEGMTLEDELAPAGVRLPDDDGGGARECPAS